MMRFIGYKNVNVNVNVVLSRRRGGGGLHLSEKATRTEEPPPPPNRSLRDLRKNATARVALSKFARRQYRSHRYVQPQCPFPSD